MYNTPWSDLGIDVSNSVSAMQAMHTAGLNFAVEMQPIYLSTGQNVPGYNFIVRRDTQRVLGFCKNRYKPLQNSVLIDMIQPLIDNGIASMDSAGILGGGGKVWFLLRLGDMFADEGTLGIKHYLLLVNGNDGKTSIQVGVIPCRLTCSNMLPRLSKSMFKLSHTRNAIDNLNSMTNILARTSLEHLAKYEQLNKRYVDDRKVREYFIKALALKAIDNNGNLSPRSEQIVQRLYKLFISGRGNNGLTMWDAFNAITEYFNYEYGRGTENRLKSLWFGKNNIISNKALELALCI